MKRMTFMVFAQFVLAGLLISLAGGQSQSLGDYARSVRKEEKKVPAKQYDNDNLPTTDKISIVGNATEPANAAAAPGGAASDAKSAQPSDSSAAAQAPAQSQAQPDAGKKPDNSAQKAGDDWKQKISDQQAQIDLLSRELDVMQREYRLRAAAFYADAGNRLRNQGVWDKQDAQYKRDLALKQKALDDARKALEDMKERARKAGVPAQVRD